jgi:hypothetical protein
MTQNKRDSTPFPLLFLSLTVLITGGCQTSSPPSYQNPAHSAEKRAADLLSRMSLEEKIGQLQCGNDAGRIVEYAESGFGALACILRNDGPREAAEKANDIQRLFLEKSRFGIPVIIHDEGLHGLIARRAVSYPQAIGLAATWDIELMGRSPGRSEKRPGRGASANFSRPSSTSPGMSAGAGSKRHTAKILISPPGWERLFVRPFNLKGLSPPPNILSPTSAPEDAIPMRLILMKDSFGRSISRLLKPAFRREAPSP